MNEEPKQIQLNSADASEPAEKQLTADEAAKVLSVDTFTIFRLIQRSKIISARSPTGEIIVPESELNRLTGERR